MHVFFGSGFILKSELSIWLLEFLFKKKIFWIISSLLISSFLYCVSHWGSCLILQSTVLMFLMISTVSKSACSTVLVHWLLSILVMYSIEISFVLGLVCVASFFIVCQLSDCKVFRSLDFVRLYCSDLGLVFLWNFESFVFLLLSSSNVNILQLSVRSFFCYLSSVSSTSRLRFHLP